MTKSVLINSTDVILDIFGIFWLLVFSILVFVAPFSFIVGVIFAVKTRGEPFDFTFLLVMIPVVVLFILLGLLAYWLAKGLFDRKYTRTIVTACFWIFGFGGVLLTAFMHGNISYTLMGIAGMMFGLLVVISIIRRTT